MRAEWIAAVAWVPLVLLASASPAPPPATATASDVVGAGLSAGFDHTCRLLEGGELRCWGANDQGQVGDGSDSLRAMPVPVRGDGLTFTAVSAGHKRTCGIVTGGQLFCWGMETARIPGQAMGPSRHEPVLEVEGRTFASVSVGSQHACALTDGGEAFCWGRNHSGELGDGSNESRGEPVAVTGEHRFTRIVVGGDHTCGLVEGGQAFCWGSNDFGELGVPGQAGGSPEPIAVAGEQRFERIAAGLNRTCGLTDDGQAFCWGSNGHGALGDGTDEQRAEPTAVAGEHRFADLALGNMHTCALTSDGAAFCWGFNGFGELGDGSTASRSAPTPVAGEHAFADLAAGAYHTCGVARSGGVPLCWGRDPAGGLAGPDVIRVLEPTPLGAAGVATPGRGG